MLKKIKWRLNWFWDFYRMKSISTLEDLYKYADKHSPVMFDEERKSKIDPTHNERRTTKLNYFEMLDHLKIDLTDKKVLDLGPGWGEFLQAAKERNASTIEFVDYHPYYFTYNRLNGYKGYRNDYFSSNALRNIPFRNYDLIISKGSINSDRFERQYGGGFRKISFPKWLTRLEFLAKSGGMIIICPTYDLGSNRDKPYKFDFDHFRRRYVFEHLLRNGYKVYSDIEGFNHKDYFPFVFVKKVTSETDEFIKGNV